MTTTAYSYIDNNGFRCNLCPGCGGSSHPSTGCAYSETCVFCWACTLDLTEWIQQMTYGKGLRNGIRFYDHAK